jgi:hypothetical protein
MGFTFDHDILTHEGWTPIGDVTQEHNVAVLVKGRILTFKSGQLLLVLKKMGRFFFFLSL